MSNKLKKLIDVDQHGYILDVWECECGFHIGIDSTYLEQVAGVAIPCPSCTRIIEVASYEKENKS